MPRTIGISAPLATVLAAVFALVGGVAGAFIKGYYDQGAQVTVEETRVGGALELERLKFQADLILKAIDTPDQSKAVKTLKFFADAGLIPAYEEKIVTLTETDEGAAIPALREPPGEYRPLGELPESSPLRNIASGVGLFLSSAGRCTTWLVAVDLAVLPEFCLEGGGGQVSSLIRLGFVSLEDRGQDFVINDVEENVGGGLALLRVDGIPGDRYTPLPLFVREPVPGEAVFMVHHPSAGPLRISAENCFVEDEGAVSDGQLHYVCKSEGGSAGAPVIARKDFALLGVHTSKRPEVPFGRSAILLSDAVGASPRLASLLR